MIGLVAFSLIGVAVALGRGGTFAGWGKIHVYWSLVALGSLAVQLILYNHPTDHQAWAIAWGPLIWTACLAALCAMLVRNACASRLTRYAWALAALGVGLNVLVVISNGGYMPQSDDARIAARGGSLAVGEPSQPQLLNVVQMNADTRLSLLGDVIPEPAWFPRSNVISIGDLMLGSGLAWWAFLITASTARRPARLEAS
jgi:hypothetical protein